MWAAFKSALGAGAGSGLGSSLLGRFGDKIGDSIFGIPGPSGREAGQYARDYYNAAFPGTNPWEQLGANSPAGSMVAADAQQRVANRQVTSANALGFAQMKTARDLKEKDKEIAEINYGATTGTDPQTGLPLEGDIRARTAGIGAGATIGAAGIGAGAAKYSAETAADATRFSARESGSATRDAAGMSSHAVKESARISADALLKTNKLTTDTQKHIANLQTAFGTLPQTRRAEILENINYIDAKKEMIYAQFEKLEPEIQAAIADATIKGNQAKYSEAMAKAQVSHELSNGLWTFIRNWREHPWELLGAAAVGAIGATGGVAAARGLFALGGKIWMRLTGQRMPRAFLAGDKNVP